MVAKYFSSLSAKRVFMFCFCIPGLTNTVSLKAGEAKMGIESPVMRVCL